MVIRTYFTERLHLGLLTEVGGEVVLVHVTGLRHNKEPGDFKNS